MTLSVRLKRVASSVIDWLVYMERAYYSCGGSNSSESDTCTLLNRTSQYNEAKKVESSVREDVHHNALA